MGRKFVNHKGFTLLEAVIVTGILALLAAVIVPSIVRTTNVSRAERETTGSMQYIADAAINFFNNSKTLVGQARWPNSISEMKDYGYLPSNWSDTNPWGNSYSISYTDHYLTVSTLVPPGVAEGIKGRLKLSEVVPSGGNYMVTTNVPVPWVDVYPDCGWSDGTNYNGQDLTLTNGQQIWGRHKRINTFTIPSGVTSYVTPYDGTNGGYLEICARRIVIQGTLSADRAGYRGGCGGKGSSCTGSADPGGDGRGPSGGAGAAGGASCDRCTYAQNGATGGLGGYAAQGINGDTSTDESLLMGSGGGGGGGGGASYGPNCYSYGVSSGGGGGAGGPGGGYIKLYGSISVNISGTVTANGVGVLMGLNLSGGNGASGRAVNPTTNCTNQCSYGGVGGDPDATTGARDSRGGGGGPRAKNVGRGGSGGNGGGGAGGGILIKSPSVVITGTLRTLGDLNNTTNGGTIKIFYRGTAPGGTKQYGRLYQTTY